MSQEEKFKEAKRLYKTANAYQKYVLESLFPELKEGSEDERIRKNIISWLKNIEGQTIPINDYNSAIAWLEKHGERESADKSDVLMSLDEAIAHCKEKSCGDNACALEHKQLEKWLTELKELKERKPAWSEEDEVKLKSILFHIEDVENKDVIDWLKSLKDRVQPQPKQEWSDEDNIILSRIIADYEKSNEEWFNAQKSLPHGRKIDWLKSLRPQSQWKPSEENIKDLEWCAELVKDNLGTPFHRIMVFIDELKKLRRE